MALNHNVDAIAFVAESNLPAIIVIIAGRNIIISEYIDNWDSVVTAYLSGTEGQGITNVIMENA